MIQLGSSEKLAQARLKAIERVRAEHKKANEKAAKEKEVLRVKFEELEGKLKSAGAAKKELARENTRLEQAAATLEKEKTELLEERDAAVEKLIGERQRLRDSRGLEVTRERERVEAAMVEKANRCFGRVRDHFARLDAFGKAKNLYGQASGTKKCLDMIKASGTEIPQEMIDVFAEQEKLYEAEATKFCVGPLSDSDLTLSLLVLPSRFVEDREDGPIAIDQGGRAETSASGPKKKKKTKRTKVGATDEVPPEESASLDATSEGSNAKKKKDGRKRSRGGAEGQEPRPSTSDANAAVAALVDPVGEASGTPENLSEERRKTCSREGGSGGEPARSTPDSSARKRSGSEGSVAKRKRIEFADRVEFSYNETTPLILNPPRCAELTRQIRGGTKEMPQLEDLYFKNEYIDAASSRARSDGSMNFLVEKYDSALKQTMIQLGSSEKLAQARLNAIERIKAEHKKANEKAAKEKEVLRVRFEELEGKLKSAGAAKKELARENTHLEQAAATLEKEKTELLEERDAAVEKLIGERQRLRDSQGLEVTRERERVEAAMVEKANRCFGRVRDHFTRLDAFGRAKNLYGQASGTKKCLEMIKASGTEIPEEMIDVFAEQEKLYEAEATKFYVGLLSDSDLTLSPLVPPSRFVEDRFRVSFDPYGSNLNLIRSGTVSQLITSLEITEEPSEEPLFDVTSVPAEHVEVPEGGGLGERPENENLEEVPGKDNLEIGNTLDEKMKRRKTIESRRRRRRSPSRKRRPTKVGNRDVPPPPAVASLVPVPTRVEDPTAAPTEDPVGPSALGTPEELIRYAFSREKVKDSLRLVGQCSLGTVRHPNTIAHPEKFFESAQAIAAHSHLRWPDLSREWIRRQQARIARVDWESRLPCVHGPCKSRLPLFTRKQQRLLDKAREMDGVPDLSALLKGKLKLLSKKSTTVDPQGPSNSGVDVTSEGPKKKKKTKRTKVGATDEVPPEKTASLDATSEGSKTKKKKDGRKRSRGGAEGQEAVLVGATSDGHPRKRTKRSVEAEPRPSTSDVNAADEALVDAVGEASGTPENLSEERRKTCSQEGGSGGEPVRSTPDSPARKRSGSEGSVAKRKRIEFPDRVDFSYNETTPLILNPPRYAELTRQIRGGTKEMPQLEDLYFKNEYIDTASSRVRSDGSMKFLVEKYDSALKQTMIQLGSSEKLAQARLKAIERVRAEHKKANEKAAEKKEVLRVKFEELEGKLKSAGAAKKNLARENTHLEQAAATLEKEKTELLEERDAAVEKLIGERQRLRDSRGLEVTRERERVEAAMVEKANHCFGRVRDHFTRLDAFGKAKNLYGQASGTKKCLEMIKASGTEIPREMIDVFAEQEKLYKAEATKFCVGPLSDSELTLSPLVLPSRFVEDRFRASFDPYGSNVNLIRLGTVSQLITSLEITEEPSEEPLVDVTSVPAEHIEVPVGGDLGERPENENLEEVPGKDNLEIGNTPVREEETGNVGIEDHVLVSDSSSKRREGEEEDDDRVEETSSLQPVEEETTDEVGNRDVPPPPAVASLVPVPTRVEDPTVAATEDPVGPSALGTPEEVVQDSAP
ncbi:hypothetical protein F2Q68_00025752 [Brassica cretica]|uniref:Uncharacterized protein n=1 Tax=Brassica cretica TaxID=69181 RepID=A0A8S9IGX8_BRACR|nr:hypothetical protein F2Q68_00025752 [Brassica cretica]